MIAMVTRLPEIFLDPTLDEILDERLGWDETLAEEDRENFSAIVLSSVPIFFQVSGLDSGAGTGSDESGTSLQGSSTWRTSTGSSSSFCFLFGTLLVLGAEPEKDERRPRFLLGLGCSSSSVSDSSASFPSVWLPG